MALHPAGARLPDTKPQRFFPALFFLKTQTAGFNRVAAPKASRAARLVVRAEEGKIAKVDRSKDTLWFASEQSLTYLDGSLVRSMGSYLS